MQISEAQALCKKHIHRYILVQTKDGAMYDGIVESVDDSNVYLAIPVGTANVPAQFAPNPHMSASGCGCDGNRAIGYPGYYGPTYPGYGYGYGGPGYGYGHGVPGHGRRFQRLILPLAALTAISLLPYF